jgi:hypothetical protein
MASGIGGGGRLGGSARGGRRLTPPACAWMAGCTTISAGPVARGAFLVLWPVLLILGLFTAFEAPELLIEGAIFAASDVRHTGPSLSTLPRAAEPPRRRRWLTGLLVAVVAVLASVGLYSLIVLVFG